MTTTKINNRRYLGNKYRLLPFITNVVSSECGKFETFADIFAGTGAVSSAYTDKILYTNDILYSNYLCHLTWFSDETFDISKIEKYVKFYNSDLPYEENYMTENFSDTQILDTLKTKGSVKTYSEQFKAFTTGKSEHLDNEKRLVA